VFHDEASLRIVVREARGVDGAIERVIGRIDETVLDAIIADLQSAHELGAIACPEPRMTALFVLGGIEKLCLSALEADEPIDLDRIVRVATDLQLFGLLRDPSGLRNPSPPIEEQP
jgi:hypothetical protein